MTAIACGYCETEHDDRYLCDPAKAFLDAVKARGDSFNVPTMEFDRPVGAALGEIADVLLRQVTVTAGTAEVAGVPRPLIVISGRDQNAAPLPRWCYIATIRELADTRNLFNRMSTLAINEARKQTRRAQ